MPYRDPEAKKRNGRAYRARPGQREHRQEYESAWREAHPAQFAEGQARRARQRRNARVELMISLKSTPCADCGGVFPTVCMDFDHRDPAEKINSIAHWSLTDVVGLLAEIAKCDLVCANCHRIRTFSEERHG